MTTARVKPDTADAAMGAAGAPGTGLCLMETQFPVAKLSLETFREREAKQAQLLTGLGKWWGRKPLVLVRATVLGLLLPSTNDPKKDRDVFLKLLTMDEDGMLRRKNKSIPQAVLFSHLTPRDRERYFTPDSTAEAARYKKGVTREAKDVLQQRVFLSMPYADRLEYCLRPDQLAGPDACVWPGVNAHLHTQASSLPELVAELGKRRFGHTPRVGDTFCGGGAIPFEAARLGCEVYGADLSPVGALLSWASLNIIGGDATVIDEARCILEGIYAAADQTITEWAIEHNSDGWRADVYLYCLEATCPECGWRVPLAPSWVIGKKTNTIGVLRPDHAHKRFDIEIMTGASRGQVAAAQAGATIVDSELVCPHCVEHHAPNARTPITVIRGDGRGSFGPSKSLLRPWQNDDVIPRPTDVFGERLYCVRWVETRTELDDDGNERTHQERHYRAPTSEDWEREASVLELLRARLHDWQAKGYLPSRLIEPGAETARLQRERGWTCWHHLFNPRQLLTIGLLSEILDRSSGSRAAKIAALLAVGRCTDWSSRLCRWNSDQANEKTEQTFSNQALNTLYNYGTRPLVSLDTNWFARLSHAPVCGPSNIVPADSRDISDECDLWITDPPYADAVNYHELGEFWLGWYDEYIRRFFADWYTDSKRALAVQGADESFRQAMVACYRSLADHMPAQGMQVVMFTHQNASVWADLALILWAAGLRVTAAWCLQTERQAAGTREGNYVQGTVLLVLRKQIDDGEVFLDEVYQDVEQEVRRHLDLMIRLDDTADPNFGDTDYQLAAYAAALRVLTSRKIAEIDVMHELTKVRAKGEKSPVEALIENAVRIACDHLVPRGIDGHLWKSLSATERFYLKGLEMESHGEYRNGVYQELARGFGLEEYTPLLAGTKANQTRLKTAGEFGRRELGTDGFGATLVRHALFAAFKTAETEATRDGMQWLHDELPDYWGNRQRLIGVLEFLAALGRNASLTHWHKDAEAAGLLAGAVRNDHV